MTVGHPPRVPGGRRATIVARRLTSALLVLGSAYGVVACGRDSEAGPTSDRLAQLANEATKAGFDGQAAILEDGTVDQAEYERAVASARGCQEKAGYRLTPAELVRGSTWQLVWQVDLQGDAPVAMTAADDCFGEFLGFVTEGRSATLGAKGETGESPFPPEVTQCMEQRGVDLSQRPTDQAAIDALNECLRTQSVPTTEAVSG